MRPAAIVPFLHIMFVPFQSAVIFFFPFSMFFVNWFIYFALLFCPASFSDSFQPLSHSLHFYIAASLFRFVIFLRSFLFSLSLSPFFLPIYFFPPLGLQSAHCCSRWSGPTAVQRHSAGWPRRHHGDACKHEGKINKKWSERGRDGIMIRSWLACFQRIMGGKGLDDVLDCLRVFFFSFFFAYSLLRRQACRRSGRRCCLVPRCPRRWTGPLPAPCGPRYSNTRLEDKRKLAHHKTFKFSSWIHLFLLFLFCNPFSCEFARQCWIHRFLSFFLSFFSFFPLVSHPHSPKLRKRLSRRCGSNMFSSLLMSGPN